MILLLQLMEERPALVIAVSQRYAVVEKDVRIKIIILFIKLYI